MAAIAALALLAVPEAGRTEETACRKVLADRIETCAADCLARARAAVDPEVRERVLGIGCRTNCTKLEMFAGHSCPN